MNCGFISDLSGAIVKTSLRPDRSMMSVKRCMPASASAIFATGWHGFATSPPKNSQPSLPWMTCG